MLEPVPGADHGILSELVRCGLEAGDGLSHRPVADDVEARLETPLGAVHDVLGDLVAVEVEVAGRLGVGVRRVHAGGARPDSAVDTEVSGEAVQPLGHRVHVSPEQLAPVGHHLGHGRVGRDRPEQREVGERCDVRGVELVDRRDAVRGRPLQGDAQCPLAVARAPEPVSHGAGGVMRVAGDQPLAAPPVACADARVVVEQGGRDDGRVGVHTRDVGDPAVDRAVQLGRGEGALFGPGRLVPAVGEQHGRRLVLGGGREQVECLDNGGGTTQVDGLQREAGRGQMRVRVHEAGRDQAAVQVDHLIGLIGVRRGSVVLTDPGHVTVDGEHRRGERSRRAVDAASAQQDTTRWPSRGRAGRGRDGRGHQSYRPASCASRDSKRARTPSWVRSRSTA